MSTFTSNNNLEMPAPNTQVNTWGVTLNKNFSRLEDMASGVLKLALSGDHNIVYATDTTDEARFAVIDITSGTGGNIIFANKTSRYLVRNNATGTVIFKNSSGSYATVVAGETAEIFNDGTNVFQLGVSTGSFKAYIDQGVTACMAYTDAKVQANQQPGNLPTQGAGSVGKFVKSDGTNATWQNVQVSDVATLAATLNNLQALALAPFFIR